LLPGCARHSARLGIRLWAMPGLRVAQEGLREMDRRLGVSRKRLVSPNARLKDYTFGP
jgi:hypothetical protein